MSPRKASGQGERTRAKLLDAARAAFAEAGFANTRVDDIVERAGTSHGTFYLYFQNKADVLEALAHRTAEDATALAAAFETVAGARDKQAALRAWVGEFVDLHRRDWAVLQAWIEEESASPSLDRLGRESLADVARGLGAALVAAGGDDAINPGVAATALIAMLERFSYFWLVRGGDFDTGEVLDTLATLLNRAIFPDGTARSRPRLIRGS